MITTVFRAESPRVVATLVRDLGDLDLAEDAAQEAFVVAADTWTENDRPDAPGAWLVTTARRKAIDRIRRERRFEGRLPDLLLRSENMTAANESGSRHGLGDDRLALVLGCCHPALAPDGQVALTLRIVAGLSTAQIARAFLVSEETMTRRISRAKRKIRVANIAFEVDRDRLVDRLGAVCAVIYAIFTEGHRVAADGTPALLADQDRSRWDRDKISRGLAVLATAFTSRRAGPYQLQAAIASLHATAPTFGDTAWDRIVDLYDVLVAQSGGPVTALNRAAAIGHWDGHGRICDGIVSMRSQRLP